MKINMLNRPTAYCSELTEVKFAPCKHRLNPYFHIVVCTKNYELLVGSALIQIFNMFISMETLLKSINQYVGAKTRAHTTTQVNEEEEEEDDDDVAAVIRWEVRSTSNRICSAAGMEILGEKRIFDTTHSDLFSSMSPNRTRTFLFIHVVRRLKIEKKYIYNWIVSICGA